MKELGAGGETKRQRYEEALLLEQTGRGNEETKNILYEEFKSMNNPKVILFQIQHEEFYFLGIENLVTENANFGAFWGNFFDKGGYDKIDPYQKDPIYVFLL